MEQRIFVTGGAGFIGSHVTDVLLGRSDTVLVYDNFSLGKREHLQEGHAALTIVEADILDASTLQQTLEEFDPTHVVHLAALHYIPYCNEHPLEVVDVNVKGTECVLQPIEKAELPNLQKFLVASSAAVYSPCEDLHREDRGVGPTDIYGFSKYANEMQAQIFQKRTGITTMSMRFFNAYGPRETNPHLIPEIVSQIRSGNDTIELGNVETKRGYTYVTDMARAVAALIDSESFAPYDVCNVGSHEEYTAAEILTFFSEILGRPITHTSVASRKRKSDRPRLQPDLTKLEGTTEWREEFEILRGLSEIVTAEL